MQPYEPAVNSGRLMVPSPSSLTASSIFVIIRGIMTIEIDTLGTLIAAIIVLFIGSGLTRVFPVFKTYHIPLAVSGGILISILLSALYAFGVSVYFDLSLRNVLLLAFFSTIGLSARIRLLLDGGKLLALLIVTVIFFLIIQNIVGVSLATLMGLDPLIGLLSGSITLSGGHGTGISYGAYFEERFGMENATEIAIACATFGLVVAGLLGGPLAKLLIKRHHVATPNLTHTQKKPLDKPGPSGIWKVEKEVFYRRLLGILLLILTCITVGVYLNSLISQYTKIYLPDFVLCLFVGIVLVNVMEDLLGIRVPQKPLTIFSNLSLDLFLTMSLMSVQLWLLADLALPLFLILAVQVMVALVFIYFVVFRVAGRNYDACVMSAGYVGFGLGATPTAFANLQAITQHYGYSYKAFLLIPLIGAFFIDIANMIVIQFVFLPLPIFASP